MVTDPFSAVMALILLAFIGTLAIFLRIWRELDALRRTLGEIRENLQYAMADADQQRREMLNLVNALQCGTEPQFAPAHPSGENLGTLLEKGLPNLVGDPEFGGRPPRDFRRLSEAARAEAAGTDLDEEDLLRRLQPVPRENGGSL